MKAQMRNKKHIRENISNKDHPRLMWKYPNTR